MRSIYDYKVYIFDLDGTIINSEFAHYTSYNQCLVNSISYQEYQQIFHSNLKTEFVICNKINKQTKEKLFIESYRPEYIHGFDIFLNNLLLLGKDIIIVTNSSHERVTYIKTLHPSLDRIHTWYCGSKPLIPKPHSDNYIKAITECGHNIQDIIIFEDSYIGYLSIEHLPVTSVFICDTDYFYYDQIKNDHKITDYEHVDDLIFSDSIKNDLSTQIISKIDTYSNALLDARKELEVSINLLYNFLKEKINKTNIFFLGVGKCGDICQKIVSTWSSIGIKTFNNKVEDLFHGEFAKIQDGDIVIFVSNSGNTEELIKAASHIKMHFNAIKIGITFNNTCKLQLLTDIHICLSNLSSEACHLNSAPTISSFLFMMCLDSVGTLLAENVIKLSKRQFKIFHPGGTLGSTKPINTVILCACGKGTRLLPLTNSIPKFLVNIDNFNVLTHIVEYWKHYTDNITIIIEKKYNNIVRFYLQQITTIHFTILNVDITHQENAYTLYNALKDIYNSQKILITWCDIFPSSPIPMDIFKGNIIFTNGNESRYKCNSNQLTKHPEGNVVGIFYFDNFVSMKYDNDKQDICDIIPNHYSEFTNVDIDKITDIGDMHKLLKYQQSSTNMFISRYFNKITLLKTGCIKKETIDDNGTRLITQEMKYYNAIHDLNLPFPKIIEKGRKYMIMEKVEGTLLKHNDPLLFLDVLFDAIDKIHTSSEKKITSTVFENDIEIEFLLKIQNRLQKIQPLIDHFGKITKINGINIIFSIDYIVVDLYKKIKGYLLTQESEFYNYNILHGDCNFSNAFINQDKITFIDPRGNFGNTFLYGHKYYDYSKILYALSGYDIFNDIENYCFDINNDEIDLKMPNKNIEIYKSNFINRHLDWNVCRYMCIIHWLGLSQYFSNNIYKSIAAFYYGIFLYHTL